MTDIPTYQELMLPTLKAVASLGGSGTNREISALVVEDAGYSDDLLAVTYPGREKSVLQDRLDWARSYCKLGGVLDSPRRGLFLISDLGQSIVSLPDDQAHSSLAAIDREVRKSRRKSEPSDEEDTKADDELAPPEEEQDDWKEELLTRLHEMTPDGFERFALYLLRSYGMDLRRVGGTGDDATAVGAEHGILITTARFSEPARKAAIGRHPTIDLVDGQKLVDLCLDREVGVSSKPVVDGDWFG